MIGMHHGRCRVWEPEANEETLWRLPGVSCQSSGLRQVVRATCLRRPDHPLVRIGRTRPHEGT